MKFLAVCVKQTSSRNQIYEWFVTFTLHLTKGGYFIAKIMGLVSGCAHFTPQGREKSSLGSIGWFYRVMTVEELSTYFFGIYIKFGYKDLLILIPLDSVHVASYAEWLVTESIQESVDSGIN